MPINYRNAGFISATYQPLQVANAPTIGTASGGDTQASVAFTAPSNVGGSAITAYYAVSNPGQFTATAASSPITVTGLSNGTAYTFSVWALNSYGPSPFSSASNSVTPAAPRGIFANYSSMKYITISSTGNATNFGNLITSATNYIAGCSSSSRAVFGSGEQGSGGINVLQYVTISTTGNATDFGDLLTARYLACGVSNETRGLFAGGIISGGAFTSNIEYITIATLGNGTNFGGLSDNSGSSRGGVGAVSSTTRAVFGGGTTDGSSQVISMSYCSFATTGNTTNFGNLTAARVYLAGAGSNTRGIFAGGYDYGIGALNIIDYITIASTGNATDFGDLTSTRYDVGGVSSPTRAVFSSTGNTVGGTTYVTIATTGNSTTFGTLSVVGSGIAGASNAHGGLQ